MEKFITVTNQKGGVGKTTTSLSLINALHMRGRRVLGVDLDPQGSLGFSAGLDIENSTTVYDVFKGTASVEQAIVPTDLGDILPSNILLSTAELEFNSPGREYMLKNELQKIAHLYDHIIIDTPPALNVLTVNAYVASDALIIPMAPEILSLLGISQILDTINTVRKYYNPDLRVLGILLNKYNMRLTLKLRAQLQPRLGLPEPAGRADGQPPALAPPAVSRRRRTAPLEGRHTIYYMKCTHRGIFSHFMIRHF